MKKGKVYTVIGVDGVQLSRTRGLSILCNGLSVNTDAIKDEAFNLVAEDQAAFIENGLDLVVVANLENGSLTAESIAFSGKENDFDADRDADDAQCIVNAQ